MARPKKDTGPGTTTAAAQVTPDPGAPPGEVSIASPDLSDLGGLSAEAPLDVGPPSHRELGPTLEGTPREDAPLDVQTTDVEAPPVLVPVVTREAVDAAHRATQGTTRTPIPEGKGPNDIALEELDELGIPRPGAILTCTRFETGEAARGSIDRLSVDLEVAFVWIENLGWTWPIPMARIDYATLTWTHVATDYPTPDEQPAFDTLHRAPTAPPEGVPVGWLDEWTGPKAVVTASADLTPGRELLAEIAQAVIEDTPAPPIGPEGYILCKVVTLGSIAGHGIRASDGRHLELFESGVVAYFTPQTVAKLGALLAKV